MTDNVLKKLSDLGQDLFDAKADVERLEMELHRAQKRVQDLSEVQIPEIMDAAGVQEFTTAAGFKLKVGDKIRGNVNSPVLHEWLRKCGHGGLIKSEVKVPFAKGEDDTARELVQELAGREISADFKQTVAWNSLQATVRKMLEAGEDVPIEDLGLHIQRETDLSLPK